MARLSHPVMSTKRSKNIKLARMLRWTCTRPGCSWVGETWNEGALKQGVEDHLGDHDEEDSCRVHLATVQDWPA